MNCKIHTLKTAALALLALLAGCDKPAALPEGGFAAQAVLSRRTLTVGDPVTLTLTARHPAGSAVRFPGIGADRQIVVRGRSSDSRERAGGILETEEIYQLTSLRTGNWSLQPEPAVCTLADGTEKKQALPEFVIRVVSTLDESNASRLSDIKNPAQAPVHVPRWLWVSALIVLIAAAAGFVTLFFLKKTEEAADVQPEDPPHIAAQKALAALRSKEWLAEPFFVELSLVLRTYLEKRFALDAPESTTEELAGKLDHDERLAGSDRQTLRDFFTQADLVKFARADAEMQAMETAFSTVETFVEQTKEDIVEPQKNSENAKG